MYSLTTRALRDKKSLAPVDFTHIFEQNTFTKEVERVNDDLATCYTKFVWVHYGVIIINKYSPI